MNRFNSIIVLFSLLLTVNLFSQSNGEKVFIDFGEEKVTKAEFKRIYEKNNSGEMVTKSTVEEYLELYINFKLKVKEAEARGLDTVSAFVNELAGYRKQLAQPYMSEDVVIAELKKEAFERLQEDIRASHILVSVSENASPEDTLAAYKKIKKAKNLVESGRDFEAIAKQYSSDPSAVDNGGDLGYFTAFYMVYPFESAAYNTKEGKVSDVVRSRFGYHILKIADRRPAVGNVRVAHILISSDKEISKTDDPEGKINEINNKVEFGEDFGKLASQFSDDTRSAANGGELQMFGVGKMVPEFEKVAFELEKVGDISKPFKTKYGWHIIKLLEKADIGSYEEVEKELTQRVKKDSRSNLSQKAVITAIKSQYGFEEELKERNDFYEVVDSSFFKGKWDIEKAKKLSKTLFKVGENEVNQQQFAEYLNSKQKKQNPIDFRVLVNKEYESFKNKMIIDYKDENLENEFPDFKALMEEYHDGILLFNLTDELVWSKASKDTVGLESFYEKGKENYKWGKRADAIVFSVRNKEIGEKVKKMSKTDIGVTEMVEDINKTSQLNVKYEMSKYEKGDNEFVDKVNWKKGFSDYIIDANRFKLIQIKEVIEPTFKTLEDSRGVITSDYQSHLEEKWIEELRKKYKYSVEPEILKELKTEFN